MSDPVNHVSTQLPYAMTVIAAAPIGYLVDRLRTEYMCGTPAATSFTTIISLSAFRLD